MPNIRRLPPFLKVVFSVSLVCVVAAFAIHATLGTGWLIHRPLSTAGQKRWDDISFNLVMLGLAYSAVTNAYARRFQAHPPNPLPLDSMRKQVLAVLLLSAAPLCAIALEFVISPESAWFGVVYAVALLGAAGGLASVIYLGVVQFHVNSST